MQHKIIIYKYIKIGENAIENKSMNGYMKVKYTVYYKIE